MKVRGLTRAGSVSGGNASGGGTQRLNSASQFCNVLTCRQGGTRERERERGRERKRERDRERETERQRVDSHVSPIGKGD